jgi:hypothetical protein
MEYSMQKHDNIRSDYIFALLCDVSRPINLNGKWLAVNENMHGIIYGIQRFLILEKLLLWFALILINSTDCASVNL